MRELRPGIWHWQSPHPDWDEEQWWPELVSSYGIELDEDFLLFDPLSVPDELRERATAVVLTAPYHERDTRRFSHVGEFIEAAAGQIAYYNTLRIHSALRMPPAQYREREEQKMTALAASFRSDLSHRLLTQSV